MHIVITEENHHRVAWAIKTPLVWIALGLLAGWLILSVVVSSTGVAGRWGIVGVTAVGALLVGLGLALGVPLGEQGYLERGPEGGVLMRSARWLLTGQRTLCDLKLESIEGFAIEEMRFQNGPDRTYPLARLRVILKDQAVLDLTDWAEPEEVAVLRMALAKAGRLALLAG